jgi:hypothetical protein
MRQWIAVLVCGTVVSMSVGLSPPPPPAAQCGAWEKGVSLNGHDITFQVVPSAAECCELCGRCGEVHFVSACRAASAISVGSTLPLVASPPLVRAYATWSIRMWLTPLHGNLDICCGAQDGWCSCMHWLDVEYQWSTVLLEERRCFEHLRSTSCPRTYPRQKYLRLGV